MSAIRNERIDGHIISTIRSGFEFETLVFSPIGDSIEVTRVFASNVKAALVNHEEAVNWVKSQ